MNEPGQVEVPQQVRELVGNVLTSEKLAEWWEKPNVLLGRRAPAELWENHPKVVLDFIQSSLCRDIA